MTNTEVQDLLLHLARAAEPAVRVPDGLAERILRTARTRRSRRRNSVVVAAVALGAFATAAPHGGPSRYREVAVPNGSMAPTALIGDVLLIDPRLRPALGDVVVAQVDAGTRIQVIKRVAAVAGDVIGCPADSAGDCHGLVVNGRDVPEPYLVGGAGAAFGPVRVPAGDVFLLGDNRADSADSRQWGPVPASDVEGVALTITTPGRHSRTVVGAPAHRQPGGGGDVGPVQPPPPAAAIPAG